MLEGTSRQRAEALRQLRAALRQGIEGPALTDRLSALGDRAADPVMRANLGHLAVTTLRMSGGPAYAAYRSSTPNTLARVAPIRLETIDSPSTAAEGSTSGRSAAVHHQPARDTRPPRRNRRRR